MTKIMIKARVKVIIKVIIKIEIFILYDYYRLFNRNVRLADPDINRRVIFCDSGGSKGSCSSRILFATDLVGEAEYDRGSRLSITSNSSLSDIMPLNTLSSLYSSISLSLFITSSICYISYSK